MQKSWKNSVVILLQTLAHSHSRSGTQYSFTQSSKFRRFYMIWLSCLLPKVQCSSLKLFRGLYGNCEIHTVESFMCPTAPLCNIRKRCWSLMQCVIRELQGILQANYYIWFLIANYRVWGCRNFRISEALCYNFSTSFCYLYRDIFVVLMETSTKNILI